MPTRNWFEQGGHAYACFRPQYPPELATFLAKASRQHQMAVDIGCGSGQLTRLLADHFSQVIGIDPSADQLAHAIPHECITYQCAPAENLPLATNSTNLITAAQAAHWFHLPDFYREVRRIAAPGAIIALISYGVLSLDTALNERFLAFYYDEIGPYWPTERRLVDAGYTTLNFPFAELPGPHLDIAVDWQLSDFLGYLSTWSAVHRAREAGREDVLNRFAIDLADAWGDPKVLRRIRWPINTRIGTT